MDEGIDRAGSPRTVIELDLHWQMGSRISWMDRREI
jgi:hypothetical protein